MAHLAVGRSFARLLVRSFGLSVVWSVGLAVGRSVAGSVGLSAGQINATDMSYESTFIRKILSVA